MTRLILGAGQADDEIEKRHGLAMSRLVETMNWMDRRNHGLARRHLRAALEHMDCMLALKKEWPKR